MSTMMRLLFFRFTSLILLLSIALTSCMSGEETTDITTDNAAITALQLGTLKQMRYTHTPDGRDTSYIVSLAGSTIPLSIDQLKGRIYNIQALPYGTDVSHIVFSNIQALGLVTIKSLTTGQDTIFNKTDSTDFSVPRTLRVHATSGRVVKDYTVDLSVAPLTNKTESWQAIATQETALQGYTDTHMVTTPQGNPLLFGRLQGLPYMIQRQADNTWQKIGIQTDGTIDTRSVTRLGQVYYALDAEGNLLRSDEGKDWETTQTTVPLEKLLTATSKTLYAYAQGKIYYTTDGVLWQTDSSSMTQGIAASQVTAVAYPSLTNTSITHLTLILSEGVQAAQIWTKDEITTGNIYDIPLEWYPVISNNGDAWSLPAFSPMTITYAHGSLIAYDPTNGANPLYQSKDGGLTWTQQASISLPPSIEEQPTQTLTMTGIALPNNPSVSSLWVWLPTRGELWTMAPGNS